MAYLIRRHGEFPRNVLISTFVGHIAPTELADWHANLLRELDASDRDQTVVINCLGVSGFERNMGQLIRLATALHLHPRFIDLVVVANQPCAYQTAVLVRELLQLQLVHAGSVHECECWLQTQYSEAATVAG
jgi:hypothetical protein